MGTPPLAELAALAGAGFLASAHCAGMCGPYVALCLASPAFGGRPRVGAFTLFTAARLAVYAVLGALAGSLGGVLSDGARRGSAVLALVMGAVVLVMGLSLAGLVRDPASLVARAGIGSLLSSALRGARRGTEALPVPLRGLALPGLLGALQGLLPCGLVYAFVARAASTAGALPGALTMAAFGLGTVPALVGFAFFARRIPAGARDLLAKLAGLLVAGGGGLLLLRGLAGLGLLPHGALW